jgi:hypothetical protein
MKKRMTFVWIYGLVFLGAYVQAQAPEPNAELKKLGFWIGPGKSKQRQEKHPCGAQG